MITTSASSVRSLSSAAPLWVFQPRARPSRNRSGTGIGVHSYFSVRSCDQCGSWLACDSGLPADQFTADTPPSPASQLPHFLIGLSGLDLRRAGVAAMGPGLRAEVPRHDHQLEQRALAHAQQVQVAVFPAVQEVADLLAAGVFPTAPDARQRAAGDAHAQYVEQLLGKLEHLRRQVLQAVVEFF